MTLADALVEPDSTSRSQHAGPAGSALIALAVMPLWLGCTGLAVATLEGSALVLATILVVSGSVAASVWRTGDIFAPPVFGGLLFLLYFPIRAIVLLSDTRSVPVAPFMTGHIADLLEIAAPLVAIGWASWYVGYESGFLVGLARSLGSRIRFREAARGKVTLLGLAALGMVARVLLVLSGTSSLGSSIPNEVASLANLLTNLPDVAVAIAFTQWAVGSRRLRSALAYAIPSVLSAGLGSSKGNVALAVLAVVMPIHYHRRRYRIRHVLVWLSLAAFILIPVGVAYRNVLATQGGGPLSPVAAGLTTGGSLTGVSWGQYISDAARGSSSRLAGMDAVMAARLQTPSRFQYQPRSFYLYVAPALIFPKALWPEKPNIGDTGYFARDYLRQPPAAISGVAVTPIADLWIHGGWLSVVIGMVLLGAISRWLYVVTSGRALAPLRGVVWFGLLFAAVNWELSFDVNVARAGRSITIVVASLWMLGYIPTLAPRPSQRGGS